MMDVLFGVFLNKKKCVIQGLVLSNNVDDNVNSDGCNW